jgi:glycosyltransferase involved in cell wall biosynthesis
MKILFIASDFPSALHPTKGVFNLALARGLQSRHDIRVIAPLSWLEERHAKNPIARKTNINGFDVWHPRYVYPPKILRPRYDFFYRRSIRSAVAEATNDFTPDVIVGYWAHPDGAAAAQIAKQFNATSAIIVGGSDILLITRDRARRKAVTKALQNASVILTVNRHLKDAVIALGIDADKIHVWSQGVNDCIFHPGDRAESRRDLQIDNDIRAIICVARLVPVKGLDLLLNACAKITQRNIPHHLYLLGDGPLRDELEHQAATLGITSSVTFAGPREPAQLADWYRAANVTVLSSRSEGLPNVLRESIACGTPFVATNVGGIHEIAGPGDRLVPPGNPDALAGALIESLENPPQNVPRHLPNWAESAEALVNILRRAKPRAAADLIDTEDELEVAHDHR